MPRGGHDGSAGSAATAGSSRSKGATATTRLHGADLDEEDLCGSGLTCRTISSLEVRAWTALQVMGLFFHWSLWREVGEHLSLYDATLAENCAPPRRRHGICLGPLWNLTSWHETTLVGAGYATWRVGNHDEHGFRHRSPFLRNRRSSRHFGVDDLPAQQFDSVAEIDDEIKALKADTTARIAELEARRRVLNGSAVNGDPASTFVFEFETRSSPPTFLVTVEPLARGSRQGEEPPTQPPAEDTISDRSQVYNWPWSMKIIRLDPPVLPEQVTPFRREAEGASVMTVEDLSNDAVRAVQQRGSVKWQATLKNEAGGSRKTRFAAYVEDSVAPHLAAIQESSRCAFTPAWKAFNEERQGDNHSLLSWCRFLLGLFMPLSAAAICGAARNMEAQDTCCDGLGFHTLVTLKFLFVDVTQQFCMVLYLLGWYNSDGLRCQLCLFHPSHCEEEHPFGLSNTGAFICTLASSVAHQMLLRPLSKGKKFMTSEDVCFRHGLRMLAVSISILPFTTGVFLASSALLAHPMLARCIFFIPCALGWTAVFMLFCMWMRAVCRECDV